MDIGFAQAGFDIAFANDIDPFAICEKNPEACRAEEHPLRRED